MSLKLSVISAYYAEQQAARGEQGSSAAQKVGIFLLILIPVIWGAGLLVGFNFSLGLLTFVGFILVVLGLKFPAAGLLGIGMLAAMDPVGRNNLAATGFFRFNTLNYWLLLVIILHLPAVLRLNDIHTRILQAFLILLVLELLFSTRISKGVQVVLEVSTMFGLLVYIVRALNEKDIFYWLGLVVGVLAAMGGLVYNLQINELPYFNPNVWAFFPGSALIVISLGLHQVQHKKGQVLVLLLLFAANFAWVFLSASRGNMLTGLVCFVFILWHTRRRPWVPVAMIVAALLGYWILSQMQDQTQYAVSRLELLVDENSDITRRTSGRSSLFEGGWKIFQQNPLGVGTGSFNDWFADVDRYRRAKTSHSAWVAVLVENGIPGILLLGSFVLSFMFVGWSRRRQDLFSVGLLVTLILLEIWFTKEFYDKGIWLLAASGIAILHKEAVLRAFPVEDPRRILRRFAHLRNGWQYGPTPHSRPALQQARMLPAERQKGD